MIKILDVCSGIGGFSLGLEATGGFDTVAFCEFDEFCGKVLNKHWPDVPIYKDLKEIGNEPTRLIQEFDLICGGIPCQPFSLAGKQKGKEDDRHLWPYMFKIIKHKKPTWVIVENVGGFVNVALDDVCLDLETEGYATQSFIIPACGVEAPHRRERVWILGKNVGNATGNGRTEGKPGEEEGRSDGQSEEGGMLESKGASDRATGHVADSEFKGLQGGERNSQGEGRKVLSPERHNRDEVRSETGRTSGVSGEEQDVANSNDNGHEGGLSQTRDQDVTGQDSQIIGATDTKDSVGQGHDGGDSQQPGADGVVSGSSDDRETVSSGATGVRGLSEESNDNEGTSREDGLKEDNDRALVQEGQSRVQSSIDRGLGSNQASSKGTQVRQGTDNNQVDRVGESKDVADSKGKQRQRELRDGKQKNGEKKKRGKSDRRGSQPSNRSTGGATEDVADSSSEGSQGHRGEHGLRETGEEEQALRGGEEQDVPNTESVRGSSDNNNGRSTQSNREGGVQSESGGERSSKGTGEDVSNSGSERGRSGQADRQDAKDVGELTRSQEHREGNTQPRLGGMDDGVSSRLDGHQGFITEPDIPRVAEKIPDRVNRLKALGNSIVPQIIYHIGMAILEEERKNEV